METYVMAANMPWYTANIRSGMRGLPIEGAPSTFLYPMLSSAPMYFPALCEKAKE
jgi:hypothetical protein